MRRLFYLLYRNVCVINYIQTNASNKLEQRVFTTMNSVPVAREREEGGRNSPRLGPGWQRDKQYASLSLSLSSWGGFAVGQGPG
jgi:hypothetical protein